MAIAKVFQSGNSQAVRLPKEYRLSTSEVEIFRRGSELILREKPANAAAIFDALAALPSEVWPDDRVDEPPQEREDL